MTATVHFWTRRAEALLPWDPDADPDRHPNAYGHAFLELFSRMRSAGLPVSIGPDPPRSADVMVVSLEELAEYQPKVPHRMAFRLAQAVSRPRRAPGVVLLRVDAALTVQAPGVVTLEVMPTRASAQSPRQRWMPLLPQRGLVARQPQRADRIETVALKVFPYNVPSWADSGFESRVGNLGMTLRIDTTPGEWRDFRDVDVTLCTHGLDSLTQADLQDARRKPPTKVINSWIGGAIPVCGDHIGYREITHDGVDALVVTESADGIVGALQRLRESAEAARRIRQAIHERAEQFSVRRTIEMYWDAFESVPRTTRRVMLTEQARALAGQLQGRTVRHITALRRKS